MWFLWSFLRFLTGAFVVKFFSFFEMFQNLRIGPIEFALIEYNLSDLKIFGIGVKSNLTFLLVAEEMLDSCQGGICIDEVNQSHNHESHGV